METQKSRPTPNATSEIDESWRMSSLQSAWCQNGSPEIDGVGGERMAGGKPDEQDE